MLPSLTVLIASSLGALPPLRSTGAASPQRAPRASSLRRPQSAGRMRRATIATTSHRSHRHRHLLENLPGHPSAYIRPHPMERAVAELRAVVLVPALELERQHRRLLVPHRVGGDFGHRTSRPPSRAQIRDAQLLNPLASWTRSCGTIACRARRPPRSRALIRDVRRLISVSNAAVGWRSARSPGAGMFTASPSAHGGVSRARPSGRTDRTPGISQVIYLRNVCGRGTR